MKKVKGFTLVELIIVMVIMSILMLGVMQMMKPIRGTYSDSVYYVNHQSAHSGIMTYISESIRCADSVGVYNGSGVDRDKALQKFLALTGISSTDPEYKRISIITIDNTTDFDGYRGRLWRSKTGDVTQDRPNVCMGKAFYGNSTYSINITAGDTSTSLALSVASIMPASFDSNKKNGTVVKTSDVTSSSNRYMILEDYIECSNTQAVATNTNRTIRHFEYDCETSTTTDKVNTYIVFLAPEY